MINLGINGFGRIGRNIIRQMYKLGFLNRFDVRLINDLTDSNTLAHLLKYDSVHGRFPADVSANANDSSICIGDTEIKISCEPDPAKIPWDKYGVDIVLECTGRFKEREKASAHLGGSVKKVIISQPSPDPDCTIVYGVNHTIYDPAEHNIISCGSCTTNCLVPVAKVLLDNFGIKCGTVTTCHSYTNDQRILDLPHKDLRRARAAAVSMIPTTTGAARAVGKVIPELAGKLDGMAIRTPSPDVSIVDFVALVEKDVTKESVNSALKLASDRSLKGILDFSEEPLVSVDYVGNPASSIVDGLSTMVLDNRLVKVLSWYDNEIGFSSRMLDVALMIGEQLKA